MSSQTRRILADFDNRHDFERLAADVLNDLGYTNVKPGAPAGGADGGKDITFREGNSEGVAFVTLEKKIKQKFNEDLDGLYDCPGIIALFCSVDVSPSLKLEFTQDAIKKGCRLEIFDLERLRSLFDTTLKTIRRRYLQIDDEVAERLREDVRKLLNYPAAMPDGPQAPTILESMLSNQVLQRLFDLLMRYKESDVIEVTGIGTELHGYMKTYYTFREAVIGFERDIYKRISAAKGSHFNFPEACRIHLKYELQRFFGRSKEEVSADGNFLNYGISWESAEQMFERRASEEGLAAQAKQLSSTIDCMSATVEKIKGADTAKNLG